MSPRRIAAGFAAAVALTTVSVASAASVGSVDGPARVRRGATAWRVDPPPYVEVDPDERAGWELVDLVNSYRRNNGRRPLVRHDLVTLSAARYARELAERRTLSHIGLDGSTPQERLAAVGFDKPAAENLGSGFRTPQAVLDAWLASPAHAANLLLDFDYIGAGVAAADDGTPYWVLVIAADEYVVPI